MDNLDPKNEPQVEALGFMDVFRLADRELIDKILAVAKTIQIEEKEDGVTRITIDLLRKR